MPLTQERIPPYPSGGGISKQAATTIIAKEGQAKDENFANVIIPSSSTSDQSFINTALSNLPSSGGHIVLLEGEYIVDGEITISDNITVSGQGIDNTTIKVINNVSSTFNIIRINDDNSSIKNLTIDGNLTNKNSGVQIGISLNDADFTIINNIKFIDFENSAIEFDVANSGNVIISDCYFTDITLDSTGLISAINGNANKIINNLFVNCNGSGFIISIRGEYNIVSNNQLIFIGTTSIDGIQLDNNVNNIVSNNLINGCTIGIELVTSSVNNNIIKYNNISDTSTFGISLNEADNNTISDNYIENTGNHAIRVVNILNISIINNYINNIIGSGIRFQNVDNSLISNNYLLDTSSFSIYLLFGSNRNQIINNYVKDSGSDGIQIINSDNNFVQNNNVQNSSDYGVEITNASSNDNIIINNMLLNSGATGDINDGGTSSIIRDNIT
jgi:parallel beta-helix repeat protein